jgi:alkylation response protein AidB-like acyl-CoA dehydrogenase
MTEFRVTSLPSDENWAVDLLESRGWQEMLVDLRTEAAAARRVIFYAAAITAEETGIAVLRARGSLAVIRNLLTNLYIRANVPIPPDIKVLFE